MFGAGDALQTDLSHSEKREGAAAAAPPHHPPQNKNKNQQLSSVAESSFFAAADQGRSATIDNKLLLSPAKLELLCRMGQGRWVRVVPSFSSTLTVEEEAGGCGGGEQGATCPPTSHPQRPSRLQSCLQIWGDMRTNSGPFGKGGCPEGVSCTLLYPGISPTGT